ncbi:hypothetical protein PHMEG_00023677 [Phytophthora megakarya]|uniref:SWIM-type domain-containing protein n=1 Tax=Phytophthora megakarya TaxID=4795 RepID=A0A225VHU8_9STRA|nr:hypothetical protein PHMEG_00023677 [Phytophthora megakarya]
MPKHLAWEELAVDVDTASADAVLSDLKSFEISKSKHYGEKLTLTQKGYCRELTDQRLRPMRIHHAMAWKFNTALQDLPALTQVHNFVSYYSRTYLVNNDRVDDLRDWIHSKAFTGEEGLNQAFTFGWDLDPAGKPVVGNGSDQRPFIVGLTTNALVLRLTAPPDSFILHVDATYKLNFREYPVLVVGVLDCSRGFHLVALFVASQETQDVIQPALMALRRLYLWLTSRDGWQLYATPIGFASTNNPVETFNAMLKRDYTLRRRLKMGTLLRELGDCCDDQSSAAKPFRFAVVPTATLTRRALEMAREGLLGMWSELEAGISVSAQMGVDYARMEVEDQTWGAWMVDIDRKMCGCNYWYAFGACVHVLHAVKCLENLDSNWYEILVSRKKRKHNTANGTNAGGRPLPIGPA